MLLVILKAICQKKSKSDPLLAHDVGLGGVGYLGCFEFA